MSVSRIAVNVAISFTVFYLVMLMFDRVYRQGFYDGFWTQTVHFKEGTEDNPITVPYAILSEGRSTTYQESNNGATKADLVRDG